jgi:DegV family protein with EDD domain
MKKMKILIDSNCDLPREYVINNEIPFVSLTCTLKNETFKDDFGKHMDYKHFYDEVRKGEMPTTSQVNEFTFEETFRNYAKEGYDILYIAFSSALSGTHNSAVVAREMVLEEFKDTNIRIVDTKSASMGEGLLVHYAYEMMKKGSSLDEIANWLEENKLKINHWFTVDDLKHLKRGGRVSATSAMIGSILEIKPILHVDSEGKLVSVSKVKGRKKSVKVLADMLKEKIVDPDNQVIGISHGDCLQDAENLKKYIQAEVNVKDFIIGNIGPGVGSHSGPGTLALFFIGADRTI